MLGMTVIYGISRWKKRRFDENLEFHFTLTRIASSSTFHFQYKSVMPSGSEASPRLILNLKIRSVIKIFMYKG
jgi:hypothetical protein